MFYEVQVFGTTVEFGEPRKVCEDYFRTRKGNATLIEHQGNGIKKIIARSRPHSGFKLRDRVRIVAS